MGRLLRLPSKCRKSVLRSAAAASDSTSHPTNKSSLEPVWWDPVLTQTRKQSITAEALRRRGKGVEGVLAGIGLYRPIRPCAYSIERGQRVGRLRADIPRAPAFAPTTPAP